MRGPAGLGIGAAAIPSLHDRRWRVGCQSRLVISFLRRWLTTLYVRPSFTRWTTAEQDGAGRRAGRGMDAVYNRLCLNSEKTSRRCPYFDTGELSVCGSLISPVTVVRDLGAMLQSDLSMKDHVARTVNCCFRHLRLLKGCIKSLPFEAAK